MATVTVRNLPEEVVDRIKRSAAVQGRSMEAELRELLTRRYSGRAEVLARIHERWEEGPKIGLDQIQEWIDQGRP